MDINAYHRRKKPLKFYLIERIKNKNGGNPIESPAGYSESEIGTYVSLN